MQPLSATTAVALCTALRAAGVRCWVMGGWGVDALLGRQTRDHHDLDVLVDEADLSALHRFFAQQQLDVVHVWEENVWLESAGRRVPSAFVAVDPAGTQLDVHVLRVRDGEAPEPLFTEPWLFAADSLTGVGTIAGAEVACVTAGTQLAMHQGYELPEQHLRDVELLRDLAIAPG